MPLAAGHGEAEGPQRVVALPHRVDVGDGQVLQLGTGIASDYLCPFTLQGLVGENDKYQTVALLVPRLLLFFS